MSNEGSEWVPKKDGEWYQGPDGMWYCWPSRDAYPMAPINPDAPDAPDVPVSGPTAAKGSALAQVDAGARAEEQKARRRHLVPLALAGALVVLLSALTAWYVGSRESFEDAEAPLRVSVQEVRQSRSGLSRVTLPDGSAAVSYAAVWRNRSRTDFAHDVTLHASLVDAGGAVLQDLSRTIPVLAPGASVAVGEEVGALDGVVAVTAAPADVGSWTTESEVATFGVDGVTVTPAENGVEIQGQVVTRTEGTTPPKLRAIAVFFNRRGAVLGGAAVDLPSPMEVPYTVLIGAHQPPGVKVTRIYVAAFA